jgi:serine/threonine-protein kinase
VAAGLAATFVLFFVLAMRVAVRTLEVEVPSLIGRSVNDASALLVDQGLALRVEDARRPDPKVPEGHVVAQEPAPGVRARRQRGIKVWVSDGPASTIVPALIGESERTAQIRLQLANLTLHGLTEVQSSDFPAGVVVAQMPAANAKAASVSLLVNRGTSGTTYVMPDLIGVDAASVADYLRQRGFRVALVGAATYPGVRPGIVLRQNPQGGFQVAPGDAISLEVSR